MSKKNRKKDLSPRVTQRDKINNALDIKQFEWTPKQQQFIELALHKETKILFVNGHAGTAKTLLSVFVGLNMLNAKKISDIVYIRSLVESASKGMGYLPGEADDKFAPFMMPLEDKMLELLNQSEINKLKQDKRIQAIPINFLRGASFNAKFLLADESQNFDFKELTTLITRLGQFSKMIVCGDTRQSDINGKSGFKNMFNLFNTETSRANGIYCFEFTNEDVMRSGVVKFILETLEEYDKTNKAGH